jgi:RNA polymerase sigma-70 factor (ECF subfamily)
MSNSGILNTELLEQALAGKPQALGELLQSYRESLLRIIKFRMDPRLRSRLDADDVVQDAFIEATQRFESFPEQNMPFFLWLRFITVQKLFQMHRRHLGAKARNADREISIFATPQPHATSAMLAAHLLGKHTSPSVAAMRAEQTRKVERVLNSMSEIDREVLALRRFERLKNEEVAELLDISVKAASNRYIRALERLQKEMKGNESQA